MTHNVDPDFWKKAIVSAKGALRDAIRSLDESGLQIALAVTDDSTLVGTITDGDIRRGLLRGLTLESPLDSVIRTEPLVVPADMERATVLQLMQANVYNAIPVIDARRRVVGLHLLKQLIAPEERSNLMVIMAGGQGTRLRPYTDDCPKPLLPVAGKPMLEHIIERAKAEGVRRFAIAIHYRGEMIENHFGDGSRLGVDISYLRETSPLGTAGALSLLNPRPDRAIVVSNGDVLTAVRYADLLDFHSLHQATATMAVRIHEWQHPFGVVRTQGVDITGFEEKPVTRSHINAGIYALEPSALDLLRPDEPCSMPELFARVQATGVRTVAYPTHEPWVDLGTPQQLELANSAGNGTA